MYQSNRDKCLSVADGLTLLFCIEALYGLFIDYSLIVLSLRIFAIVSVNSAFNIARRRERPEDLKRASEGKQTRSEKKLLKRLKKSLIWMGLCLPYHLYYIYFSLGAFSGVNTSTALTDPVKAFPGFLQTFIYGTHQMLYLTEQATSTVFLLFVPAMQPVSVWGGRGGLLGPGVTIFLLDLFLLLTILSIYSALYAARNNGTLAWKGLQIFSIDTESHISSRKDFENEADDEEEQNPKS